MSVHSTSPDFKKNAARALGDAQLQKALGNVKQGFIDKRQKATERLPEFEALRNSARDIKNHTLQHLDLYLEAYEEKVTASGGHVHFARNAEEARDIILSICQDAGARTVTKGKSMISEEIGINQHLEQHGIAPVETDLGEYIIQLRNEMPSHIIAPAVHLNATQVEQDFRRVHTQFDPKRDLSEPVQLLTEARNVLRERFLAADVGITGANFLVAETGTSVIVTNEGNGDLTQILPKPTSCWRPSKSWFRHSRMSARSCAFSRVRRRARSCRSTPRSRPARAVPATVTDPRTITWCCLITAVRPCLARASRKCCAAFAAAPA